MLKKYFQTLKQKSLKKINKKNGIDKLSPELQQKLECYSNPLTHGGISTHFTWDEFCEIFKTSTLIFEIDYQEYDILLIHDNKDCVMLVENVSIQSEEVQEFPTAEELLKNAHIDNKKLFSIWHELI